MVIDPLLKYVSQISEVCNCLLPRKDKKISMKRVLIFIFKMAEDHEVVLMERY